MNIHSIRGSKYPLAALAAVLGVSMGLAQGARAETLPIARVFVVQVPPAQDHAFNEGVKAWEKCLKDHGDKQATVAYDAVTGDLSRYLFLNRYTTWAAMDMREPAGKACRGIFATQLLPHVGSAYSDVSEFNAKDSYMPEDDTVPAPMMWVDAYRIKPGQGDDFKDSLAMFASAAAKAHWEGHFSGWDVNGAGQGGPHFVLVWPNKNWADVGQQPNPSTKDMMDSAYGKDAAKANHDKFMGAIAEHWSDGWSFDKDLSYIPGK